MPENSSENSKSQNSGKNVETQAKTSCFGKFIWSSCRKQVLISKYKNIVGRDISYTFFLKYMRE